MNKQLNDKKVEVLAGYKLKYEDIKEKKLNIKKPTKKSKKVAKKATPVKKHKSIDIRGTLVSSTRNFRIKFNDVVNKVKHPSKKPKKLTKIEREEARRKRNRGILGVGQLLVVVSITYSTTVILIGVDSIGSKIALLPQAVFALVILIKAFSRLYK